MSNATVNYAAYRPGFMTAQFTSPVTHTYVDPEKEYACKKMLEDSGFRKPSNMTWSEAFDALMRFMNR